MKAAETPKEKPRLLHICQRESVFRGVLQAGNSCCRSQRNRNVAAASYSWWSLPQTWWHVLREEQLFTLPSNSKPWRRSNYCYRNTRHPVDIARVRILCILCAISGIFFPPHQNTPSINNWSIFHTTRFLSCWNQNPVPCKWPSMDPAPMGRWRVSQKDNESTLIVGGSSSYHFNVCTWHLCVTCQPIPKLKLEK